MSNHKFIEKDQKITKILLEFDKEYDSFQRKKVGQIHQLIQPQLKNITLLKKYESKTDGVKAIGHKTMFGFQNTCIIKHKDKCVIFCNYKNSKRNGEGYVLYHNGLIFKGQFKNDIKVSGIVYNSQNFQIVYQGGWKNDIYHGRGILVSKNNDKYEGEFIEGQFEGYGVQTWSNGDKYEGQFKGSMKHGKGQLQLAKGDLYKGDFQNNFFDGFGTYIWKNGEYYEGEFKHGQINGQGKFIHLEGITAEGKWNMHNEENVDYRIEDYNESRLISQGSNEIQF